MRTRKARFGALSAVLALLSSMFVAMIATAPFASANTSQNNGCLTVSGTMSQFTVPITGTASPNPLALAPGATTTLSGTSVAVSVDSTLIGAGVATGFVSAAPSLADIGTDQTGGGGTTNAGIDAIGVAAGSVKLKITGTNTVEGVQTATNASALNLTFYVVVDPVSGVTSVYTGISSPPSATPDPSRTGTLLVGALPVTVGLADTTWTATGGDIVLAEQNSVPSSLTAPTPGDKAAAPLQLTPKINGTIPAAFNCWPGTVNAAAPAPQPLIPGPSTTIDTVVVNAPATAPSCTTGGASVGVGQSVTIDLTARCTDVNGNWNAAGTGYPGPIPPLTILTPTGPSSAVPCAGFPCALAAGTINTTATPGVYQYTNTSSTAFDGFGFLATDGTGMSSAPQSFVVTILSKQCDATSSPCHLDQTITVGVTGTTMTLDQAGADVTLGTVTLDGEYKITSGALQQLTVTNARGTGASWSLTGAVTDFKNGSAGAGTCDTAATYDRNCIPGNNMAWGPVATIAHTPIPGDVAAVTPGATGDGLHPWTSPLNTSSTLCSSAPNHSGGTFHCNATLWLGVPASAGQGTYTGKITLTLA